jgi:AcrR family transcriptional regulator
MAGSRRTQEERSEATRGAILQAARKLFAVQGYAATSIDQILSAAGVTRGALYHHFDSKSAIFSAVFAAVEADLAQLLVAAAAAKSSPWSRLLGGSHAFLDACLNPEVRQIVIVDAPAVLGADELRGIKESHTRAALQAALSACADAGEIDAARVPMLTHLISGALAEAAMAIARSADLAAARDEAWGAARALLSGLRRG